jgi:hypothetical protein
MKPKNQLSRIASKAKQQAEAMKIATNGELFCKLAFGEILPSVHLEKPSNEGGLLSVGYSVEEGPRGFDELPGEVVLEVPAVYDRDGSSAVMLFRDKKMVAKMYLSCGPHRDEDYDASHSGRIFFAATEDEAVALAYRMKEKLRAKFIDDCAYMMCGALGTDFGEADLERIRLRALERAAARTAGAKP